MTPATMHSAGWGSYAVAGIAMAAVVVASNYLVQFPVHATVGSLELEHLLTWGAFTYPIAFLINDLTNRVLGPRAARWVVLVGFAFAVVLSVVLSQPRIAIASGSAFLLAQLLDISVFDRLRDGRWWRAPVVSSSIGSAFDTLIFFTFAFAASFSFLGPNDAFATEIYPLFGVMAVEAPRWVSWALGDFVVKMIVALLALAPYGILAFNLPVWTSRLNARPGS